MDNCHRKDRVIRKYGGAIPADVQVADKAVYAVFHGISFKDIARNEISGSDLDSALLYPDYLPKYKLDMDKEATPIMLTYDNDTLCYACCVTAEQGKHFQQSLVAWNLKTGDIHPLINGHPEVERVRIRYAVSLEKNLIAVSYDHHDLLATYDLQGNLKHYIYGPNWDNATSNMLINSCIYLIKIRLNTY